MDGGTAGAEVRRQHLIDPEICIRCGTCEEVCPEDAISHDAVNYFIDFEICTMRGDCLPPCPTGAIDSYRKVTTPWTVEQQLAFEELPPDAEPELPPAGPTPGEVEELQTVAASAAGGPLVPPWSAAHPYVNLYAPEAPATAVVQGNMRLTADGASSDIHHIVLDMGTRAFPVLEGQSIGIVPPGTGPNGKPHHLRLYSVASPREGERTGYNNIALCVKRVTEDENGNPVTGVASNYLCDLEKGDEVRVCGPYGTSFLMPNHPGANIVMICTGTGSAPMRAMTERRRRKFAKGTHGGGALKLYFGARTAAELPYLGPLRKLPKELIDVRLAFSREPGRDKRYVQDELRADAEVLAELLRNEDSYLYICGHKRMEAGVEAALAEICADHGMDWAELKPRLRQYGRYHVETY